MLACWGRPARPASTRFGRLTADGRGRPKEVARARASERYTLAQVASTLSDPASHIHTTKPNGFPPISSPPPYILSRRDSRPCSRSAPTPGPDCSTSSGQRRRGCRPSRSPSPPPMVHSFTPRLASLTPSTPPGPTSATTRSAGSRARPSSSRRSVNLPSPEPPETRQPSARPASCC